jgi:hypothetical protein
MTATNEQIEAAARAICLVQFGSEFDHGEARCCQAGGTGSYRRRSSAPRLGPIRPACRAPCRVNADHSINHPATSSSLNTGRRKRPAPARRTLDSQTAGNREHIKWQKTKKATVAKRKVATPRSPRRVKEGSHHTRAPTSFGALKSNSAALITASRDNIPTPPLTRSTFTQRSRKSLALVVATITARSGIKRAVSDRRITLFTNEASDRV